VLLPTKGRPRAGGLADLLADKDGLEDRLRDATLVLDCAAGGLRVDGLLDETVERAVEDVAASPGGPAPLRILLGLQEGGWSPIAVPGTTAKVIDLKGIAGAATASQLLGAIRGKELVEKGRFELKVDAPDEANESGIEAALLVVFSPKRSLAGLLEAPVSTP